MWKIYVYKHEILLHELYNLELPEIEWITLNFQQLLTAHQTNYNVIKTNQEKWATTFIKCRGRLAQMVERAI